MVFRMGIISCFLLFATVATAEEFDHPAHQERAPELSCDNCMPQSPCNTCHKEGAREIIPDKAVCLECHDREFVSPIELPETKTHGPLWAFNHRPFAKGGRYDCSSCHQQDFCLECHKSGFADEQGDFGNNMANVHRSDFQVSHPIAARTDPQLCSSCHENSFCVDCHSTFAPEDLAILSHRRGFTDGTFSGGHDTFIQLLPNNPDICQSCHNDSVIFGGHWSASHAREARKNLSACQACHPEGEVCLRCHSARSGLGINPHPADWNDIDGRLRRASDGKTCRRCH